MSVFYSELTDTGVLQIQGPDSDTFLQGQTTCDLEELRDDHSITGAYCTPQGRMVCDFRLLRSGEDSALLRMHRGTCEHAATVFGKYIVFSKAEIRNASDDWRVFGLWGDSAAGLFTHAPGGENHCWGEADALWVQLDAAATRFEAFVPAAQAEALQRWLDESGAGHGSENDWRLQDIRAGHGHLEPATVEEFIPQMLNYQLTGQVSFTKGCYTGQEVVARMHYRGKLKRPMYLARIDCAEPAAAGDPLFSPDSTQSVGNVVNTAASDNGMELLAVVTTSALPAGIHLGDPAGPKLAFGTLPYALEDEQD